MKKYWIFILSMVLFLWTIGIIIFYSQNVNNYNGCTYDYVEKVYDGDTVFAEHLWKIRLLWIDAPEIYHTWFTIIKKYKFYACWEEAKKIAEEKLLHKKIYFCSDPYSKDKWWYWRKLRYAMIYSWNKLIPFWMYLLKMWYARVYKKANFKYKKDYLNIEKENKEKKIWIWSNYCLNKDKQFKEKYLK